MDELMFSFNKIRYTQSSCLFNDHMQVIWVWFMSRWFVYVLCQWWLPFSITSTVSFESLRSTTMNHLYICRCFTGCYFVTCTSYEPSSFQTSQDVTGCTAKGVAAATAVYLSQHLVTVHQLLVVLPSTTAFCHRLSSSRYCSSLVLKILKKMGTLVHPKTAKIFWLPPLSQERIKPWTSNFVCTFIGVNQGVPKIFTAPIYRVHRKVIVAIAQLSCHFSLHFMYGNSSVVDHDIRKT